MMEMMMAHALLVGIGGFIGSILRYWLAGVAQRSAVVGFPAGTLTVNVLGCLAIGAVMYLVEFRQWFSPETRVFLIFGVLGGFTTFSALGFESFALLRDHELWTAFANVMANVVLGTAAVLIGWTAAKAVAG